MDNQKWPDLIVEKDGRIAKVTFNRPEKLNTFDFVVASVHSRFSMDEEEMTQRIVRAIAHPASSILGHLTGRLLLEREGYRVDVDAILEAAARSRTAVEINAHPSRLDLDWRHLRYGLERGLKTSINPDAHSPEGLQDVAHGVGIARKGWCTRHDVLNTRSVEHLLQHVHARRRAAGVPGS